MYNLAILTVIYYTWKRIFVGGYGGNIAESHISIYFAFFPAAKMMFSNFTIWYHQIVLYGESYYIRKSGQTLVGRIKPGPRFQL
jgi:hypothetical protein